MTKAQLTAHKLPRKSQKELVLDKLHQYPSLTVNDLAAMLELPPGRITARLNDLQKEGKVYASETEERGESVTLYRPELNPAEWPRRATHFKRFNHYVAKFARKVKADGLMNPRLLSELQALFLHYQKTENL